MDYSKKPTVRTILKKFAKKFSKSVLPLHKLYCGVIAKSMKFIIKMRVNIKNNDNPSIFDNLSYTRGFTTNNKARFKYTIFT